MNSWLRWGGALMICLACLPAIAGGLRVAFINPGAEDGPDVWSQVPRFMKVAARQLDLELEIHYADRDRQRMVALARQLAERAEPPDYVILVNEKQLAPEMMALFSTKRTRILLMHNDLTPSQRQQYGSEREHFPNWIGTLVFDPDETPFALMRALYRKSVEPPRILGINGDRSTPISPQGEAAVRKFVAQSQRGELLQVVAANWTRADAEEKARGLLMRYPQANMIWAANDTMALGALDAVTSLQRRATVQVGGMGTFPEAVESVLNAGLSVTAGGGALLSGALCLVLIHDYAAGRDFIDAGGVRQINNVIAVVADAASATQLRNLIAHPDRIDFRRLTLNPRSTTKAYGFNFESILAAKLR